MYETRRKYGIWEVVFLGCMGLNIDSMMVGIIVRVDGRFVVYGENEYFCWLENTKPCSCAL